MAGKKTHNEKKCWLEYGHCAEILDVSQSHFEKHIRPKLGPKDMRRDGRRNLVSGRAIYLVGLSIATGLDENAPPTAEESFRRAKARKAELELGAMEGQLLRREFVHAALVRMAAILRSTGEVLRKNHGEAAVAALNDALENFEREIESGLKT